MQALEGELEEINAQLAQKQEFLGVLHLLQQHDPNILNQPQRATLNRLGGFGPSQPSLGGSLHSMFAHRGDEEGEPEDETQTQSP